MNQTNIIKLIVSIALPLLVGGVAGVFTAEAIPEWYASLNQPSFNPPNWVFGPVWTTLYIIMGVSFFMVWRIEKSEVRNRAFAAFFIQLFLNFLWSFFFFYLKNIGLALSEIILLWVSIAVMIYTFYRVKPVLAYTNIPYLLWVSFATALNAAYFSLN